MRTAIPRALVAWWIIQLAAYLLSGTVSAKEPTAAESSATIAELSWLAGHWQGKLGASEIEEVWTAPSGQSMLGMFRIIRGDQTAMYELCAIEQAAAGPRLVVRHYSPGLLAREQEPLVFALADHSNSHVTFVRNHQGIKESLSYRVPAPDELEMTLRKEQGEKKSATVFKFTRRR